MAASPNLITNNKEVISEIYLTLKSLIIDNEITNDNNMIIKISERGQALWPLMRVMFLLEVFCLFFSLFLPRF